MDMAGSLAWGDGGDKNPYFSSHFLIMGVSFLIFGWKVLLVMDATDHPVGMSMLIGDLCFSDGC